MSYEEYKKSNISWVPMIPANWDIIRGKYLYNKENREVRDFDETVTCFRDGEVTLRKNRRTEGFTESLKESGYQGVRKGDLVIHVMDAFAGAVGVSDSDGKATPVYSVCTAKKDLNNYYYAYLLREMARAGFIQSLYRGIRERSSDFRFDIFADQKYPLPPRKEQDQIVRYLDWKVSLINKLIHGYRLKIKLLEERKRTFTFNVVTQGLNEDVKKAADPLYWLSSAPIHWDNNSMAQLFFEVKNINTGMQENNLLSLSYGAVKRRNINATEGLLPASFEGYNIIEKDDIVLRMTDLQNDHKSLRTGISTERGIITSAYITIRNKSKNNSEYLHLFLHAFDLAKGFYNVGASGVRQSLNWDTLKTLKILIPPIEEQNQIVSAVKTESIKTQTIVEAVKKQIEFLEEYRTRLISDVVTGQTDVRGIAIPDYTPEEVIEEYEEDEETSDEEVTNEDD